MEKLIQLKSVAAPIPADNLDTDQLMPKQFLRGIDKKGLARGCLFDMRFLPDGTPNPECVLNRPGFEGAQIIVGGPNFGCGSSREHAVWGLLQMGVRAVIAPGFGEIFYSNCFNNGLLAAKVTAEAGREIMEAVSETDPTEVSIDVASATITVGSRSWPFAVSARHRTMLLEGLDMVGTTLKSMDAIRAFAARHEAQYPWMAGLPARVKARLG